MGWTFRDRIPVGTRFSVRPDRTWGPPSLLFIGYRVFPGGRGGRGVGLTPHPHLVPKVIEKSTAIPLLTLRAFVAYEKGENLRLCSSASTRPGNSAGWQVITTRCELFRQP